MSPSYFLLVLVVSRSPSAVNAAPDRPLPLPQSLLGPRATVMAAAATATALVAAAAVVGNLAVLSLNEEGIQPIAASVGRFRHRRGLAPTPESTVETTPQPAVETPQAESAVETPPEPAVETNVTPTTAVHFYHDAPADMPVIDMHWCTAPAPWFAFAPKPGEEWRLADSIARHVTLSKGFSLSDLRSRYAGRPHWEFDAARRALRLEAIPSGQSLGFGASRHPRSDACPSCCKTRTPSCTCSDWRHRTGTLRVMEA